MPDSELDSLRTLISSQTDLEPGQIDRAISFYQALLAGNKVQNLTRLTSPEQFLEGHLIDVIELHRSGLVKFPAVDWGSGCGVPGLLYAVIYGGKWILIESERSKALFLGETAEALGLASDVQVLAIRGEVYLKKNKVGSVVARAVARIPKFFSWMSNCSTWNNLILLKAKSWDEEWSDFSKANMKLPWKIKDQHRYEVGPEKNKRVIVSIQPV